MAAADLAADCTGLKYTCKAIARDQELGGHAGVRCSVVSAEGQLTLLLSELVPELVLMVAG